MKQPCIGIIGAGAVGQFLGAVLTPVAQVTWFLRGDESSPPSTLRVVGHTHLTVDSPQLVTLGTALAEEALPNLDLVFFCVKATALEMVGGFMKALRPEVTKVFVQNGLGILDRLKSSWAAFDSSSAIRMLCRFGVVREERLLTRLAGPYAATLAPVTERTLQLRELLQSVGFSVELDASIAHAEWQKAILNVFVNLVCTMYGERNEAVIDNPLRRQEALALVREAQHVARAEGIDCSAWTEETLVAAVQPFRSNINSYLADVRAGRVPEIDALLGELLRRAKRHAIEAPALLRMSRQFSA